MGGSLVVREAESQAKPPAPPEQLLCFQRVGQTVSSALPACGQFLSASQTQAQGANYGAEWRRGPSFAESLYSILLRPNADMTGVGRHSASTLGLGRGIRSGWLIYLAGLLAGISSPALCGAASAEWRYWQTEQGLKDSYIEALDRSPNGIFWAVHSDVAGLSRFDGRDWVRIPAPSLNNQFDS